MKLFLLTWWNHKKDFRFLSACLWVIGLQIKIIQKIWKGNRTDSFLDCYLIITNKVIIDVQSALRLVKKGYYGSASTICAALYRTQRMLIYLHVRPESSSNYLDEDFDTYQVDRTFSQQFSEGNLIRSINDTLGPNTTDRNELEKVLHGSGYTARKYYCNRILDNDGMRAPLLRFTSFYESDKAEAILKMLQAFVLDNIGIFLEHYRNNPLYESFAMIKKYYFALLKKAGVDTESTE